MVGPTKLFFWDSYNIDIFKAYAADAGGCKTKSVERFFYWSLELVGVNDTRAVSLDSTSWANHGTVSEYKWKKRKYIYSNNFKF